jgi:hypothetical protein
MQKQHLLVAAIAFCVSGMALAQGGPPCTERTLRGLYVFSATGYNIVSGTAQPKAIVELIDFNGDGTLTVPAATRSINGVIGRSPPGGTGSYEVLSDCTGTVAFTGGPSFDIFVPRDGDELWMIQTHDPSGNGPVLQGNVVRLSR